MNNHQFVFPPPPPPPPQASPNHPIYGQPTAPQNSGYGTRGNRGDRGFRGRGRGDISRGSRGGPNRGPSSFGGQTANRGEYASPPSASYRGHIQNTAESAYPLPNYPPIQQPQYPAYLPQEYGYSQSALLSYSPSTTDAHSPYGSYTINNRGPLQHQIPGPQQAPYVYDSAPQSSNYNAYDYRSSPQPYSKPRNHQPQPLAMGPPIRMGFDDNQAGGYQHSPLHPQPYNHSHPNGLMPRANGQFPPQAPPYPRHPPDTPYHNRHNSPKPFPGRQNRGQKRGRSEAFGRPRDRNTKVQAAPAVPSFGIALPEKPPVGQQGPRKPRKKKRKQNQLGLTPKTEEHESSSEEEILLDEEAELAASVPGGGQQQLQFTFKGKTATLNSSSEIAAWVEERKKRYPTKARAEEVAERKRQLEEVRQAANRARKEAQAKRATELCEKQKPSEMNFNDVTARARLKAEKLRKQLKKEERRIAKAEVEAAMLQAGTHAVAVDGISIQESAIHVKRKRSDSVVSEQSTPAFQEQAIQKTHAASDNTNAHGITAKQEPLEATQEIHGPKIILGSAGIAKEEKSQAPLTPTSQASQPEAEVPAQTLQVGAIDHDPGSTEKDQPLVAGQPDDDEWEDASSLSMSDSSSDITLSDVDDETSSSGSSSDGGAPEEAPSTRSKPERVPPPKREKPKSICKDFLKSGRCRKDKNCIFRHELPKRGSAKNQRAGNGRDHRVAEKRVRKGLYQRLVEQEQEQEDRQVVQAIISLGERGLLDEPKDIGMASTQPL